MPKTQTSEGKPEDYTPDQLQSKQVVATASQRPGSDESAEALRGPKLQAQLVDLAVVTSPYRDSVAVDSADRSPAYRRKENEFWMLRALPLASTYRFALHDKRIPDEVRVHIPEHVMILSPLCTMRMEREGPHDRCWSTQGSFGSGGLGTIAAVRINFFSLALTKGCEVALETTSSAAEGVTDELFDDYFNFGDGCSTVEELTSANGLVLKDMRGQGGKSCIGEAGIICRVTRVKGSLIGRHLIRTVSVMRRKYYSRYHPTKDLSWFPPFASSSNLVVGDGDSAAVHKCQDLPLTMTIVVHLRRGDMVEGMKRWVPDEAITQLLTSLVGVLRPFEEGASSMNPMDHCPASISSSSALRPEMRFVLHFLSQVRCRCRRARSFQCRHLEFTRREHRALRRRFPLGSGAAF